MKNNNFVSPLDDYAFKQIFGEQQNIGNTRAFLKTLLDVPEEEYGRLTVVSPNLGSIFKKGKKGIVDIKLTTKSGKIIHIELQVEKRKNLRNRITYYITKHVSDQLKWGDDYDKLHQVISIIICDHNLLEEEYYYHNEYGMKNDKNHYFTKLIKLIILELPKLPETEDGVLWPWLKFLKCKKKEDYEMLAKKYPELEKPIHCARKMSWLDKWRDIQFHRNLAKVDERMLHEQIKDDARAEGLAEGRADEKIMIAKNLFAEGSSLEFVQKITGLPLDKINALSAAIF
ncbi:MAG: Rpn family recombination-promoting nuclease/putative transposase [Treponema sp.]|nr:Rpn family recombination-promoting nuclease/putative transposase [Treponema sp.]